MWRFLTRRAGEAYEYSEGMTLPALPQGKQIMAWSVIGFNYKEPLIRFDLNARTPPLRYDLQRPFRETQRNGINGPKYAEWIVRGPLFEAMQAFTSMGRLPIVMKDNAPCHNNEYADRTRAELGLRRLLHRPNSPDLNPIENVWFDLQGRIADFPIRASTSDALWAQAERAWGEICHESGMRTLDNPRAMTVGHRQSPFSLIPEASTTRTGAFRMDLECSRGSTEEGAGRT